MRRFGVQCAVWCDKWPTQEMTNGRMALPRLESLSVCAYRGGESLRCAGCGEKHGVDTTHDTLPAGDSPLCGRAVATQGAPATGQARGRF